MKKIRIVILAALSAGWLLPLYLAFDAFRSFFITELEPMIAGRPLTHSFGMLYLCGIWLAIAAWWLAFAIVFWVVYVLRLEGENLSKSDEGVST